MLINEWGLDVVRLAPNVLIAKVHWDILSLLQLLLWFAVVWPRFREKEIYV
jgi:hypothetical protein